MFTGIVQAIGTVTAARRAAGALLLEVSAGPLAAETSIGDSVGVDGACLTAVDVRGDAVSFDVGSETLRLTTLGSLAEGSRVNLEPALRASDRLGGHFVQGHVDGVGTIRRKEERPGEVRLAVGVEPELTGQMILKGSVALDGISLTIAALQETSFEVSLIPHTLAATTMQFKRPGDRVNVECDMIGRWVRRLLAAGRGADRPPLSLQQLEEQGF